MMNDPRRFPRDLCGVVCGDGLFRHAECFDQEDELEAAIDDEDTNTIVLTTDDWRHTVGLCAVCHRAPDKAP